MKNLLFIALCLSCSTQMKSNSGKNGSMNQAADSNEADNEDRAFAFNQCKISTRLFDSFKDTSASCQTRCQALLSNSGGAVLGVERVYTQKLTDLHYRTEEVGYVCQCSTCQ